MMSATAFRQAILALSLGLFSTFFSAAQTVDIPLGQYFNEEVAMKECSFDKGADAVILLDHGVAYFDENHNLISDRRIRLKILKERGIERGNIHIPYYNDGVLNSSVPLKQW